MLISIGGQPPLSHPSVATIGFFDGVHRGHRYLIDQVREVARRRKLASMAVTFPVHPRRVMQSTFQPRLLLSCEEKVERLALAGLDQCLLLDFTPDLARFTARQFMQLLRDRYHVQALVIGHDHRFGHDRLEGLHDYICYGRELGLEVVTALPLTIDNATHNGPRLDSPQPCSATSSPSQDLDMVWQTSHLPQASGQQSDTAPTVSSSIIRRLLEEGDVHTAALHLGYNYFLKGAVVDGHHIGRTLGYPTANLLPDNAERVIPGDGVYAVQVSLSDDSQTRGGMMNIGRRPTLDNGTDRTLEVHVFGLHADLYRQAMRVTFINRLRSEQRFDNLEELAVQLQHDEAQARQFLRLS